MSTDCTPTEGARVNLLEASVRAAGAVAWLEHGARGDVDPEVAVDAAVKLLDESYQWARGFAS